ncbi:ABC transporter substrate-binding protein [Rhizobacter sp. LjRoot28]|uniref:ABC transporter substrate-binding protein n=1 Tax=Rhizobacter sp. LjRoot28 TaxID=3342309 RepID=UPI003ECF1F7A
MIRLTLAFLGLLTIFAAQAEPLVIRFGVASPSYGIPPGFAGGAAGVAHAKRFIEEEFKGQDVKVEWIFFKGVGPAVNEAMGNGQLDFAFHGDLPSIVTRANGVRTRAVMAATSRATIYIGVAPNSPIHRVQDLKGKRIAFTKGTASHLPVVRILAAHGLKERDLKVLNLDAPTAQAAFLAGDLDALIGAAVVLKFRDQGQARLIYSTRSAPTFTSQSHITVTDAFATARPDATRRVVRGLVRAARWTAEPANRDEVISLWSRAGVPVKHWNEELAGEPLAVRTSPLYDPFITTRLQQALDDAHRFRLVRRDFDVNGWIDRQYVDAALKDLGLEGFWTAYDAEGRPLPGPAGVPPRGATPPRASRQAAGAAGSPLSREMRTALRPPAR